MRDRRSVDELSIEELEAILLLRKREARLERLRRLGKKSPPTLDPLTVGRAATPPEPMEEEEEEEEPRRGIRWDWVREKTLLLVELLVVAALFWLLFDLQATIRRVNQEATQAQQAQLPTIPPTTPPTPTPLINVVILPGGHTPPDSPGGAAPAEIPAHLRPLVEAITPLPVPTPGPEQAVRIRIPAIGVDAPVVEGDDWESLKQGAGHHIGSANPGESGNCIISAHDDVYGEIFRHLDEVDLGDEVFIHTASRIYRYVVTQKRVIEPTDVSVMYPTTSPIVTLITCYPYGVDTHRLVVIAELSP